METKTSKVKSLIANGEWHRAIKVAARFPRLGHHRNAIHDASDAITTPDFFRQIGRNPDEIIRTGIDALVKKFNVANHQDPHQ